MNEIIAVYTLISNSFTPKTGYGNYIVFKRNLEYVKIENVCWSVRASG
jgi:hypothetical protein